MRAGTLREIISVESPTPTTNEYGERTYEYEEKIKTRASVEYLKGNRILENDEIFNAYTKVFTTRYYHKIKEDDIIVWNENRYRILTIEPDRERQKLIITTELINE